MLKMEGVTVDYPLRNRMVRALDGVSLEISRGEFVAVVGQSGSGKSTLLHVLGAMLSPASGSVRFDGRSVYELDAEERSLLRKKSIGFVFQTFNLVPYLTALENVQIPLLLAGLGESTQKERAVSLLNGVGLSDRLDHKPSELSIGQQQRVALARMLANDPCVILADEPTGNLDPDTGREILSFLESAHREGRTVVMVTHDPQVASGADRVIRLAGGRLI